MAALAAITAIGTAEARADWDWVVRPVASFDGSSTQTADVLLGPAAEVSVGYAFTSTSAPGPVWLAKVNGFGMDYTQFQTQAPAASFAADKWGGVYFAACPSYGQALRYGQNLDPWGPIAEQALSGTAGAPFALALAVDAHGIPAMAGPDAATQGRASYTFFDVRTGTWQTQLVGTAGTSAWSGLFAASMCFDAQNQPAIATIQRVGGNVSSSPQPLVLSRRIGQDQTQSWTNDVLDQAVPASGLSIAAAAGGELGFAYVNAEGLMFASDQDGPSVVAAGLMGGHLSSKSLVYDSQGNPAIVYGAADGQMHYFSRAGDGVWQDEVLPVAGVRGSLAMDAADNPYIAVVGPAGVTLLGLTLPAIVPGDASGDGKVTDADYTVWADNYSLEAAGKTWSQGDFSGDGKVTDADYTIWADNYGYGVTGGTVPEPATLSLLALGGLAMIRRRQK